MKNNEFTNAKVFTAYGELKTFDKISDFQVNFKSGMLVIQIHEGQFIIPLDRLRYFEVGLVPQSADPAYRFGEVMLTSLSSDKNVATDIVHIPDIIRYDWKIDHGLLMIYGKKTTFGFHLDHVVSYRLVQFTS